MGVFCKELDERFVTAFEKMADSVEKIAKNVDDLGGIYKFSLKFAELMIKEQIGEDAYEDIKEDLKKGMVV